MTGSWKPAPHALFAGMAIGFLLLSAAGRYYAGHNIYDRGFQRFHRRVALDTNYFPTASQMLRLAEDRLPADKIGVIVGGSSVMYGVGQRAPHVWTKRLQSLLGGSYRVVNLAQRAGAGQEMGNWFTEMLLRRNRRIVYVTDFGACGGGTFASLYHDPTGNRYQDVFWDAYTKGLIQNWPERAQRITEIPGSRKTNETKLFMRLDSIFYFRDLWTSLQYLYAGTFYNSILDERSLAPRRVFEDDESEPAPQNRYRPDLRPLEVQYLTSIAKPCSATDLKPMDEAFRAAFSPQVRPVLVGVFTGASPHYDNDLGPRNVQGLRRNMEFTQPVPMKYGATMLLPPEWNELDFADRAHLAEIGGAKLADVMAPAIRQKAHALYGVTE